MKLALKKCDTLENWYIIEKAEHSGASQLIMDGPSSGFLWCASRICDADIEGHRGEMLAIAEAIEQRKSVGFKRCAVDARDEDGEVRFWSPRNSRMHGVVFIDDAMELAAQIRHELGGTPVQSDAKGAK